MLALITRCEIQNRVLPPKAQENIMICRYKFRHQEVVGKDFQRLIHFLL